MKTIIEAMREAINNPSIQSGDQVQLEDSERLDTKTCVTCKKIWKRKTRDGYRPGNYSTECNECGIARRADQFSKLCPKLYQDTEINRLPQKQLSEAMDWKYGQRGLILLGETGKGKTRIAWTLLKRVLVESERSFLWFDCIGFGHEISRHYREEDAEDWLDRVASRDLLFFDDLGKLKLTERAEVELFGVIERRCAAQLPIIVTTNDTGDSLAARMSDNRGPAMIRRLREFCDPIQFI